MPVASQDKKKQNQYVLLSCIFQKEKVISIYRYCIYRIISGISIEIVLSLSYQEWSESVCVVNLDFPEGESYLYIQVLSL